MLTATASRGGSADSDITAVAVKPPLTPSDCAVITQTAAAKRRMPKRKPSGERYCAASFAGSRSSIIVMPAIADDQLSKLPRSVLAS
ncbi:MAG: hypothetical protein ABT05_07535 [Lautropia sp. SCN 66-9]|nr:MAG: hypothetical protein ABT05_07535 [Lautropia sp. SCN 66-9]